VALAVWRPPGPQRTVKRLRRPGHQPRHRPGRPAAPPWGRPILWPAAGRCPSDDQCRRFRARRLRNL